jgi:hypothetical protein
MIERAANIVVDHLRAHAQRRAANASNFGLIDLMAYFYLIREGLELLGRYFFLVCLINGMFQAILDNYIDSLPLRHELFFI